MGCTNSKTKDSDAKDRSQQPQATPVPLSAEEKVVATTAESYFKFLQRVQPAHALHAEWVSFVSTCDFVLNRDFNATRSERRTALEQCISLCPDAPQATPEQFVDDRLGTMLRAWTSVTDCVAETVSGSTAYAVMIKAKTPFAASSETYTFGSLCEYAYEWSRSEALEHLYDDLCPEGEAFMAPEALQTFLAFGTEDPANLDEIKTLIATRLGGAVTKLRFVCHFGHPETNDVLDPKKAKSVWQDMSQPLTQYSVATRSVRTREELTVSLAQGVRAFVLHIRGLDSQGVPQVGETFPLNDCLTLMRQQAFTSNPLPVVLCFLPETEFTVEVQDACAGALESCLGDAIAPGLMFRGADLKDPKFSPLGLQKRFLIMAQQGPLKPFVGFNVADMQRSGLGVRVTAVPSGTPAARAGIGRQDWLTHFNGEPIESKDHLKSKLSTLTLGDEFRVRKEGLTDISGIVGSSVTENTESISRRFSSLLFLNYIAVDGEKPVHPGPWDTEAELLPQTDDAAAVSMSGHRFHFVSRDAVGSDDNDEREYAIASADDRGAQFIDTEGSAAAQRWARGKFADNGHCGYVLKNRVRHQETRSEASSDAELSRHDVEHSDPVHLDLEILGQVSSKSSSDSTCAAALIGTPERHRAPLLTHAQVDVADPDGKVVMLRTFGDEGRELEAALPISLVRPGYRVVTFTDATAGAVVPVLCAVKRVARGTARNPTPPGVQDAPADA